MALTIWSSLFTFTMVLSLASATLDFPLLMPGTRPSSNDSYLCTAVRLDPTRTHYITGFKAASRHHAAHHMLVFGCSLPGSELDVWKCGEMINDDDMGETRPPCDSMVEGSQIVYAWAMDAPDLELPDEVAFRVGADTDIAFLVLQIHYADIGVIKKEKGDTSGVYLEVTDQPKSKMAGVLLMGVGGLAPPHTTTFFETACQMQDTRTLHPFAFRVHTHKLGKVVTGYKVANDDNGDHVWSLIGKQDPQKPQMFYPVANDQIELNHGDVVAARCTMVNPSDSAVAIGSTMDDEMCNFYLMYWLDDQQTNGPRKPVSPNTCYSMGPPLWSWAGIVNGAGLTNIPHVEASTI